jgi:hypothetical protein
LDLSDAEVRRIARHIFVAVRGVPPDDQSSWILSQSSELSETDESRVVVALERLRRDR